MGYWRVRVVIVGVELSEIVLLSGVIDFVY
jgi:hypothetical protein